MKDHTEKSYREQWTVTFFCSGLRIKMNFAVKKFLTGKENSGVGTLLFLSFCRANHVGYPSKLCQINNGAAI